MHFRTGLAVAMCLGLLAAMPVRADVVTAQDTAPVGKPVIVPLVNIDVSDGVQTIYLQDV